MGGISFWSENSVFAAVFGALTSRFVTPRKSVLLCYPYPEGTLDFFGAAEKRTVVGKGAPMLPVGDLSIRKELSEWRTGMRFDVAVALQTLDREQDPTAVARQLLELSKTVIVSVPYKWPEGRVAASVQSPVDEFKLLSWFGRSANFQYLCREVHSPADRYVLVFEKNLETWSSLSQRWNMKQAAAARDAPLNQGPSPV